MYCISICNNKIQRQSQINLFCSYMVYLNEHKKNKETTNDAKWFSER